jgi:hypothetical protein
MRVRPFGSAIPPIQLDKIPIPPGSPDKFAVLESSALMEKPDTSLPSEVFCHPGIVVSG